jgi:hypothetical protein
MSAAPALSLAEQGTPIAGRSIWRDALEPYARADRGRSLFFVLVSVLPPFLPSSAGSTITRSITRRPGIWTAAAWGTFEP